jgi:hypothetical protein
MAPVCFVAFLFLLPIKKYPLRKLELPERGAEVSVEKANQVHATAGHEERATAKFSFDSRTEFASHVDVIDGMDLDGPESPRSIINSDANIAQVQYNTVWKGSGGIGAKDKRRSSNRPTL